MNALLLLLLDSRSPAGGHNHSGSMEPAVTAGLVRDAGDVEAFCRLRLRTAGTVAAAFAAAATRLAEAANEDGPLTGTDVAWDALDAELDARLPSAAARATSRQLGRGLGRLVRATIPEWRTPWTRTDPHHPLVLGAAVAAAGGSPELAARAAGLATVGVPASGAVRLLGLDPFVAHAVVASLAPEIDALAAESAASADPRRPHALAAGAAPALDLLADVHPTAEVRLFAS